ncbi:hypothetical protein HXX76_007279 [Chlamydomonas incerta]|uniref:Uncharacterized protein n=1 Tax=Chlamydomonas incerta TaxID=51695 RepID=A0A835T0R5_CHLIN|nr:hypothetical protein HXX76_007279 [Chlamydomonas incerta]|eukprot:KAG2435196.1 hypothetical protein HXX76_007279 [Chlamydomonas incerta]
MSGAAGAVAPPTPDGSGSCCSTPCSSRPPAGASSPSTELGFGGGYNSSYAANAAASPNAAASRSSPKAGSSGGGEAAPNLAPNQHPSSSRSLHHQTSGQQRPGQSTNRADKQQPHPHHPHHHHNNNSHTAHHHHIHSCSSHGYVASAVTAAGGGCGGVDATAAMLLATGRVNMAAAHMERVRRQPGASSDTEGYQSEHHGHSPGPGHHSRHHDTRGHHREDEEEGERHSHHRRTPGGGRQRRVSVGEAQLRGRADSVLEQVRNAQNSPVI